MGIIQPNKPCHWAICFLLRLVGVLLVLARQFQLGDGTQRRWG
jgi:hypothetical protein